MAPTMVTSMPSRIQGSYRSGYLGGSPDNSKMAKIFILDLLELAVHQGDLHRFVPSAAVKVRRVRHVKEHLNSPGVSPIKASRANHTRERREDQCLSTLAIQNPGYTKGDQNQYMESAPR